jgi:hypothetical protein
MARACLHGDVECGQWCHNYRRPHLSLEQQTRKRLAEAREEVVRCEEVLALIEEARQRRRANGVPFGLEGLNEVSSERRDRREC